MTTATALRIGALIGQFALWTSCSQEAGPLPLREFGTAVETAPLVSMVAVLAAPDRFDSHQIRVQAVLHLELEGDRVCLDRDSAVDFVPQNCLRLSLGKPIEHHYNDIKHFNGQYVLVAGTLYSKDRGTDYFPGRLVATNLLANLPSTRSQLKD